MCGQKYCSSNTQQSGIWPKVFRVEIIVLACYGACSVQSVFRPKTAVKSRDTTQERAARNFSTHHVFEFELTFGCHCSETFFNC